MGQRTVSLSAALCALFACSGDVSDGGAAGKPDAGGGMQAGGSSVMPCNDERGFSRQVWGRVLGKVCINCHAPDGVAAEQNAMLRLLPSAYPGFLDANFDNASYVAKFSFEGKSLLLRKPLGEGGAGRRLHRRGEAAELRRSDPARRRQHLSQGHLAARRASADERGARAPRRW